MEKVECLHCKGSKYEVISVNSKVVLLECLGCGAKYDAGIAVQRVQDCKEAQK